MDNRYHTSFTLDQKTELKEFFDKYGFVVVDGVLSDKECEISQNEVWAFLSKRGVSSTDPQTWENDKWPQEICRNGGFMGRFPYFNKLRSLDTLDIPNQDQAWENRQNPKIYEAFTEIMNTKRLWVSIDRYGIMRPTLVSDSSKEETKELDSAISEQKSVIKSDWKTKPNWLHWDLSPFHYGTSAAGFCPNSAVTNEELRQDYGGIRVQGLVTLVDCPIEVGGFHCVPGFHGKEFFEWGSQNQDYANQDDIRKRNFVEVPQEDAMRSRITPVPVRKGSLVVWNSQLPHGNFPNSSEKFRMVQYIKMINVDEPREFIPGIQTKKHQPDDFFPKDFVPSELGKKLFGVDGW